MTIIPHDLRRAYHDLAKDPKYQHFRRIPDRIIQCIDYFGIRCDRDAARTRLQSYYLFIGVVDEAIDSDRLETGRLILDYLVTPTTSIDREARPSNVQLITEILKYQIGDEVHSQMINKLRELYDEVVSERRATAIGSYIEHRLLVGSLTAELSYILIQPDLIGEHEALLQFMKQVGAIGCLVDSLIDLSADRRLGLLGFKPGPMDYTKLFARILRDGMRVSLKHLGLSGLFLRAIVDNMRDRFRADRNVPQHLFVSDRKDAPAGVA